MQGTVPIKRVNFMSVDTLHKGFFSLYGMHAPFLLPRPVGSIHLSLSHPFVDGDSRGTAWMFMSYNDKIMHHIVDIIRKNQALTITEVC